MQARKDWNSTLSPGHNSYFYPGASIVYNFTNDFSFPKLKYGKLRFSWANVGGGPNVSLEDRYFADNSYSVTSIYEGATVQGVFPMFMPTPLTGTGEPIALPEGAGPSPAA